MDATVTAKLSRLDRALDYFIPEGIQNDRVTAQRARIFLLSHIAGPLIGGVLPLYMWLTGFAFDYRLIVFVAALFAFWVFPFLLKWTGNYLPLAILSIQNLSFVLLWICYSYGGIASPFSPWLVTIPLLAFFYINPQGSLKYWVFALVAMNFGSFYLIDSLGVDFPEVDAERLQGPGFLSMAGAAAFIAMMALYYAQILASQVDLENEVRLHKETERELRRTTETARRSGTAKSDFIANMSHELRTPLNAVIGYSQMLMDDALIEGDQETADDLHKIQTAGQHLLRLVNDVLDFSKIEAGKMEVARIPVPIAMELEALAEKRRPGVEKRRNKLTVNVDPSIGSANLDWPLTAKIISHLLDNAAKFTEGGEIKLSAQRCGDTIEISVSDSGAGIPDSDLPNLFNAFRVIGEETSSKYRGTGIGLALSDRICELLGGTISVESAPGRGSVFTMSLPTGDTFAHNASAQAA